MLPLRLPVLRPQQPPRPPQLLLLPQRLRPPRHPLLLLLPPRRTLLPLQLLPRMLPSPRPLTLLLLLLLLLSQPRLLLLLLHLHLHLFPSCLQPLMPPVPQQQQYSPA
jgi:hypothetical protein